MLWRDVDWNPTPRKLRQFGAAAAAAAPFGGWLWGWGAPAVATLAGLGLVLAGLGWAAPRLLRPAYLALTLLTAPVGFVVGELSLIAVYFGTMVPLALLFRLLGRDALERKFDPKAETYWRTRPEPKGGASYFRQS